MLRQKKFFVYQPRSNNTPSFCIRTKFRLKDRVTTVYLLQCKTYFLIHVWEIYGKLKNIYPYGSHLSHVFETPSISIGEPSISKRNLVFRLRNLVFRLKYLAFRFENYFFNRKTKSLKHSIEKLSFSIKIPSFNEKFSLSKILRFQLRDSCSRSRNMQNNSSACRRTLNRATKSKQLK